MPAPTTSPDLAAAILIYLKESTAIAAFTSTRIYIEWPKGTNAITIPDNQGKYPNCILINTGRGGPGDIELGLFDERVDLFCYGANKKVAYDLWRTMNWYLMPSDRSVKTSFTRLDTRVHTIFQEGAPNRLVDPDKADWHYCAATYIFRYSGVPAT